jgi:hypothetical protein
MRVAPVEVVLELRVELAKVVVEPGRTGEVAGTKGVRERLSPVRDRTQMVDEVMPYAEMVGAMR